MALFVCLLFIVGSGMGWLFHNRIDLRSEDVFDTQTRLSVCVSDVISDVVCLGYCVKLVGY